MKKARTYKNITTATDHEISIDIFGKESEKNKERTTRKKIIKGNVIIEK